MCGLEAVEWVRKDLAVERRVGTGLYIHLGGVFG